MLLKVKALLEERGRMNLRDLAVHFHITPQALEPILEQLIHSGTIRRVESEDSRRCSTCPGCSHASDDDTMCWYETIRGL